MPRLPTSSHYPPRILKIGGSLLTRRGAPFQVDHVAIARLAAEIADGRKGGLVIAHGLGSFGRAVMPLYDGDRIAGRRSHLARRVLGTLAELSGHVADGLDSAGIPVSPLDAGTLFAWDGTPGGPMITATSILEEHLAAGRVPLLHGGTLLTTSGDFAIVSSDRMMIELACAVQADLAVWATDVDGVLDRDRQLLDRVSHANLGELWRPDHVASDPTGAMHGKVAEALRLAGRGISSVIVNGFPRGRVRAALQGSDVVGTRIGPLRTATPLREVADEH